MPPSRIPDRTSVLNAVNKEYELSGNEITPQACFDTVYGDGAWDGAMKNVDLVADDLAALEKHISPDIYQPDSCDDFLIKHVKQATLFAEEERKSKAFPAEKGDVQRSNVRKGAASSALKSRTKVKPGSMNVATKVALYHDRSSFEKKKRFVNRVKANLFIAKMGAATDEADGIFEVSEGDLVEALRYVVSNEQDLEVPELRSDSEFATLGAYIRLLQLGGLKGVQEEGSEDGDEGGLLVDV